jgi:hypothetical protein
MARRFLPILILWLFAAASAPAALEISKPVWGFNGTVVQGMFNPLTIEIRNGGPKAFDGEIILNGESAPSAQQVFIGPGSSRVVQFFPYIQNSHLKFSLAWKDDRTNEVDLDEVKVGAPAVAILADLNGPSLRSAKMRVFPENLFPPTVAATGALAAVVLDHAPRWDPPRREAFVDWVRSGGMVHLVRGINDELPQFTEELAVLNGTAERTAVGAGVVLRHVARLADVSEDWLKTKGFPAPEIRTDGKGNLYDFDSSLFAKLSAVTRPNIAWGQIYLLTAIYIALIGPVFYLLRRRDYRLLLLGFLLTVAGFAWIFTVVGRRGYGEKQIYHSVAIARSLGGARWDVVQWIHAFATSGDTYRFQHPGGSHLYAAPSKNEPVRGSITTGKDAHFDADIPLFSSRPFLHAGVLAGDDCSVEVVEWENARAGNFGLKKLRLKPGAGFPQKPLKVGAQSGNNFYTMELKQNVWTADQSSPIARNAFFSEEHNNFANSGYYGYDDPGTAARYLREMSPMLIARFENAGEVFKNYIPRRPPAADHIRLFIYAEAPAGFRLAGDQFQSGIGYVLYVQDISKP